MALKFKFIGWCNEGDHDKVWGVIFLETPSANWEQSYNAYLTNNRYKDFYDSVTHKKCITFWGRRGKKLQTKTSTDDYEMFKLITSKLKKGYQAVDKGRLDAVYPEFQTDLEETAFWATLKG
jgi:predicted DNA-binding WGR domain protein